MWVEPIWSVSNGGFSAPDTPQGTNSEAGTTYSSTETRLDAMNFFHRFASTGEIGVSI